MGTFLPCSTPHICSLHHQSLLNHFKNQYEPQETRFSMLQPLSEDQLHNLVGRLVPDPTVFAQGVPLSEEPVEPILGQEENEYVVVGTTRAVERTRAALSITLWMKCGKNKFKRGFLYQAYRLIVLNPATDWAFCPICPKVFEDESSVYRHDDIHKSERQQCPLCDRSSVQRYNLRIHMETHIGMDVPKVVKDMLPNDFRGVIDGNPDFINPARFHRKLVRALKKRIKATTCMQTVQSLQSKLL